MFTSKPEISANSYYLPPKLRKSSKIACSRHFGLGRKGGPMKKSLIFYTALPNGQSCTIRRVAGEREPPKLKLKVDGKTNVPANCTWQLLASWSNADVLRGSSRVPTSLLKLPVPDTK